MSSLNLAYALNKTRLSGSYHTATCTEQRCGVWVFLAVSCFLSFIWTYMFVLETNGHSLEQMGAIFKDTSGEHDQARWDAIAREIATSSHVKV